MPGIDRRGDRGAEVNVPQSEHQIVRRKDCAIDVINRGEAVDPADEFDVAWAPWRVWPNRLHIFLDRQLNRWVVPRERQMDGARGHDDVAQVRDAILAAIQLFE